MPTALIPANVGVLWDFSGIVPHKCHLFITHLLFHILILVVHPCTRHIQHCQRCVWLVFVSEWLLEGLTVIFNFSKLIQRLLMLRNLHLLRKYSIFGINSEQSRFLINQYFCLKHFFYNENSNLHSLESPSVEYGNFGK